MSLIKLPAILLASVAIALFSGCGSDSSNNTDTSAPTVPTGVATTLGVQAVDARTGVPIANSTLIITGGADAFNEPRITSDTGIATFTVREGNDPTATAINVSVKASASNFLDSNKSTTITNTGATDLIIELVSTTPGAQPEGVGVVQETATSNDDGSPSEPITATATSENESASITVGTNVQMTDERGQPVTGNLTVSTAYYDANSSDALEAFPGGFTVAVDNAAAAQAANNSATTGEVGSDNQVTFISGGFTSIQIASDNGSKVKNFSEPVPITITISANTINPDTGNPVQAGEELPIWGFDEDTGKWSYEGQGTVADADATDGLLEVTYNVTHLSYFNLDWFRSGEKNCTGRINVLDNNTGTAYAGLAKVQISQSGNSKTITYTGDGFIELFNLIDDIQTTAVFTDPTTGIEIGSIGADLPDLCGTNDVSLATLIPPTLTNLTVKTVTYCANDASQPEVAVPSSYITLSQDSPSWTYIDNGYTDNAGEYVFNNLVAQSGAVIPTYTLYVYDSINNTTQTLSSQTLSAGSSTITVRFAQTCPVTTGAG